MDTFTSFTIRGACGGGDGCWYQELETVRRNDGNGRLGGMVATVVVSTDKPNYYPTLFFHNQQTTELVVPKSTIRRVEGVGKEQAGRAQERVGGVKGS